MKLLILFSFFLTSIRSLEAEINFPHDYIGVWISGVKVGADGAFSLHEDCEPGGEKLRVQKDLIEFDGGSGSTDTVISYSLKDKRVAGNLLKINDNLSLEIFEGKKASVLKVIRTLPTLKKTSEAYFARDPLDKNTSIKYSKDDCSNWKG